MSDEEFHLHKLEVKLDRGKGHILLDGRRLHTVRAVEVDLSHEEAAPTVTIRLLADVEMDIQTKIGKVTGRADEHRPE